MLFGPIREGWRGLMGRVGTDCKPRATNGLLEGDTGHFRRWRVGNKMHHHGGLGLLTPHDVPLGVAAKRHAEQKAVLRKGLNTLPTGRRKKEIPIIEFLGEDGLSR